MYTEILEAALGQSGQPPHESAVGALAELSRCRVRLRAFDHSRKIRPWSASAFADQMAYDIALIELARSVGLACEPRTFDQPERRRTELEFELLARGIDVDDL